MEKEMIGCKPARLAAYILCGVCLVGSIFEPAAAEDLNLCVDSRHWYPFTFSEQGRAKGMHVEIVRSALENLGYRVLIAPVPRRRCVRLVEKGTADGMISVAHAAELGKIMEFPSGAATDSESPWRIMQVDHMAVTHLSDPYEFENDIANLPNPVRVPQGESLIAELKNAGRFVEEARTDEQNFGKLKRDKGGTVVTTSVMAEAMNNDEGFKGVFRIQSTPLFSQSYHLAFHRGAKLSSGEMEKIWREVARLRDDYVYMLQLFARY